MGAVGLRGRIGAALAAAVLLGGLLMPSAEAAPIANPGPIEIIPNSSSLTIRNNIFDITPREFAECSNNFDDDGDGFSDILDQQCDAGPNGEPSSEDNSEVVDGFQVKEPTELKGTIDADGDVTIPKSGVSFPTTYLLVNVLGNWGTITVRIVPTHDATGTIDPTARTASLRVRVKVTLAGTVGPVTLAPNCSIGTDASPIDVPFNGTYSPGFGIANLSNNTFAVPGATGCGTWLGQGVSGHVSSAVGLPSGSGLNSAVLSGTTEPKIEAPGATTTTTTTTTSTSTTTTTEAPTTTTTSSTTTTTEAPTTTTTSSTTTTTEAPTTTTSTTTTTQPSDETDAVSLSVSGGTDYDASGELTSGLVTNSPNGGAWVSASIDGPSGGSARVGARIVSVPWLRISLGTVSVTDRASGVHLALPYIGRPTVDGNTISGVARGIQRVPAPHYFAPVAIDWSFTDNV